MLFGAVWEENTGGGKSRVVIIPNQSNIKVHFAGAEVINQFYAVEKLGIKYTLYTAFPFLERTVLNSKKSPIMPCHLKDNPFDIPKICGIKVPALYSR